MPTALPSHLFTIVLPAELPAVSYCFIYRTFYTALLAYLPTALPVSCLQLGYIFACRTTALATDLFTACIISHSYAYIIAFIFAHNFANRIAYRQSYSFSLQNFLALPNTSLCLQLFYSLVHSLSYTERPTATCPKLCQHFTDLYLQNHSFACILAHSCVYSKHYLQRRDKPSLNVNKFSQILMVFSSFPGVLLSFPPFMGFLGSHLNMDFIAFLIIWRECAGFRMRTEQINTSALVWRFSKLLEWTLH